MAVDFELVMDKPRRLTAQTPPNPSEIVEADFVEQHVIFMQQSGSAHLCPRAIRS